MHSASTQALVLIALVALVATPLADAAKSEKLATPKGHQAPPPSDPPAAPTPAPAVAPAPVPAQAPAPDPGPRSLPQPPARPDAATAAAPRPATLQRAEWNDLAAARLSPEADAALALAPASLATAAVSVPSAAGGPLAWALPILGLFGVGIALLARPRRRGAGASRADAAALAYTTSALDVPSLLRAGKACVERGALIDAVAWFSQALALDPTLSVAHFAKGVCLAGLGRHEEAHASLAEAYALDPTEGAVRLEYARAASRTRRAAAAMDALAPLLVALPEIATDVQSDEAFAGLRDHPRFLAMVGAL